MKLTKNIEIPSTKLKEFIDKLFESIDNDIDYYFEVLERFDKYQGANDVKDYFLQKMMGRYKAEPMFWHHLVKAEQKGKYNTFFDKKLTSSVILLLYLLL